MFILIVGSRIRYCSLQLGYENSLLHLRSGLLSSLFLLLLLYLSFFLSINRLFFFLLICVWNLEVFLFYRLKECLVQSCLLKLSYLFFLFFDFSCFILFLGSLNHKASLIQWITSVWFGNLGMHEFCGSVVWNFLGFILVIPIMGFFSMPFLSLWVNDYESLWVFLSVWIGNWIFGFTRVLTFLEACNVPSIGSLLP